MAFLDNPAIILAHIRQSHVTSDDTGMCEMVLIDQDVDLEKCQLTLVPGSSCGSTGSGSLSDGGGSVTDNHACDLSQSMDITSSWDFGIRRRSNTGRLIDNDNWLADYWSTSNCVRCSGLLLQTESRSFDYSSLRTTPEWSTCLL